MRGSKERNTDRWENVKCDTRIEVERSTLSRVHSCRQLDGFQCELQAAGAHFNLYTLIVSSGIKLLTSKHPRGTHTRRQERERERQGEATAPSTGWCIHCTCPLAWRVLFTIAASLPPSSMLSTTLTPCCLPTHTASLVYVISR